MRRLLLAISMFMMGGIICIGRQRNGDNHTTEVGVDIVAATCRSSLRITAGRQLLGHWSLEGVHTLMFGPLSDGMSEEEEEHYGILGPEKPESVRKAEDMVAGEVRLRYWMHKTYEGGYFMAGCRMGHRTGIDGTIGCGYSIRIWRGWRCTISYEVDVRRSYSHQSPQGNGLGFILSYTY